MRRRGLTWWNMKELDRIGCELSSKEKIIQTEANYLSINGNFNNEYAFKNKRKPTIKDIEKYIKSWEEDEWPRRPIPGFHPGIYKERAGNHEILYSDPYADYIRNKEPEGKWKSSLITHDKNIRYRESNKRVAIHIHVHYIDILGDILNSIKLNKTRPDLFLTYNKSDIRSQIEEIVGIAGVQIKQIIQVPNKGRDIGPLVTTVGKILDEDYDVYGHVHTKRSELIDSGDGKIWSRFLLSNLLGMEGVPMADVILDQFGKDKKLGIVFPCDPTCVGWTKNRYAAEELAKRLDIPYLPNNIEFPIGNMFWQGKEF